MVAPWFCGWRSGGDANRRFSSLGTARIVGAEVLSSTRAMRCGETKCPSSKAIWNEFGSVLLFKHEVLDRIEVGIQGVLVVRRRVKAFTPLVWARPRKRAKAGR